MVASMRRFALIAAFAALTALPAAAQDDSAPVTPVPIVSSAAPPSPAQCRTACAQEYYFCLSNQDGGDCYPQWDQCRRGCSSQSAD